MLDECEQGDELDYQGLGVSPRVYQQRGHLWLHTRESLVWVRAKARGRGNEITDDLVLHLREGVTIVNVG